jgi:rhodanese-related sulfurtransferase
MTDRIPAVTVDEARARLDADSSAVVLDVREAEEWQAGHVDGSHWIPMGELAARQSEIPQGPLLVVVCRSGGRSARVTQALVAAGYDAANLVGGLEAWTQAGQPLVTDAGGTGVVA